MDLFLPLGPWHTLMGGSFPSYFSCSLIQAGEAVTNHKYFSGALASVCVCEGTVRHISKSSLEHQMFKARENNPMAGREGAPVLSWP